MYLAEKQRTNQKSESGSFNNCISIEQYSFKIGETIENVQFNIYHLDRNQFI